MTTTDWGSRPLASSGTATSAGTMTIRPMRMRDLAQVSLVDHLSFSLPWPESAFRYELLDNPYSYILVAEDADAGPDAQVVGAIVVWLILDEAHIATLAVHPDHRRSGIASQLLLAALQLALKRGSVTATLEVRSKNDAAQELYRKFHFEVVGHRPRYYRDDYDDALIMTVDLYQVDEQGRTYLEMIQATVLPTRKQ